MSVFSIITTLFAISVLSWLFTAYIRRYSLRNNVIDIPNERSSHKSPTPRGGGLSITILCIISTIFSYFFAAITLEQCLVLAGGSFFIGLIGWLDDHIDVAALWRAVGYFLVSCWSVYWLDNIQVLTIAEIKMEFGLVSIPFTIISITWMVNLYNFMDGIDALAATQAVTVAIFLTLLFYLEGQLGLAWVSATLVMATAGFLIWNLPPAGIFMGDVGSCVIGFILSILAYEGEVSGAIPISITFILLAVFIFDATLTLFMRIVKGEKWYSAHSSHAYQRVVQMGYTHGQVTGAILIFNMVFIWPMAWAAYIYPAHVLKILLLLHVVMILIWSNIQFKFNNYSNE